MTALQNKTALVTGASRGIGRATAVALAEAGAHVLVQMCIRDSINTNPVTGVNLIDPNETVYGIVTDNNAIMFAAKYKWDPLKFFAGYEYTWQNNPKNPLGVGASDQGGYIMSGVEDNNLDTQKLVNIWWMGAKLSLIHISSGRCTGIRPTRNSNAGNGATGWGFRGRRCTTRLRSWRARG